MNCILLGICVYNMLPSRSKSGIMRRNGLYNFEATYLKNHGSNFEAMYLRTLGARELILAKAIEVGVVYL